MKYYNIVNNEMELTDKGKEALNRLGITLDELPNYPNEKLSVDYWKGCMTYIDQALKNGHGATWLDDCRIPFESEDWDAAKKKIDSFSNAKAGGCFNSNNILKGAITQKGRFPANVLCEDDVLNDGRIIPSSECPNLIDKTYSARQPINFYGKETKVFGYPDKSSFSRYFSLDAWFEKYISKLPQEVQSTFPFLITPKPSESEKQKHIKINPIDNSDMYNGKFPNSKADKENKNKHPTVKPLKLMM